MKKLLSCFLVLFMVMSLFSTMAMAEGDYHDYEEDGIEIDATAGGLKIFIPQDWLFNAQGVVDIAVCEEMGYNSGVYVTMLVYNAMTREEYDDNGIDLDRYAPLYTWVLLKDGFDPYAASNAGIDLDFDRAVELCNVGDNAEYTFYVIIGEEYVPYSFTGAYMDEYTRYLDQCNDIVYSAIYGVPVNPHGESVGQSLDLDTEDVYGNPVNTRDLFSEHEITMLNCWGTWCPHCIEELPQIEEINARLAEIDCGVVGLLTDSEEAEKAQNILQAAGVSYPIIKATEECFDIFALNGLPITYFVNRNGEIVGFPIEGAQVDKYEEAVRDLLAQEAYVTNDESVRNTGFDAGLAEMKQVEDLHSTAVGYRVICVGEDGTPVAGAKVQLCTNDVCMMGTTNDEGIAEFDTAPSANNVVHLLKPPSGYEEDSNEYHVPAGCNEVSITLHAG